MQCYNGRHMQGAWCSNWRPVALTCIMSKCFSKHLHLMQVSAAGLQSLRQVALLCLETSTMVDFLKQAGMVDRVRDKK